MAASQIKPGHIDKMDTAVRCFDCCPCDPEFKYGHQYAKRKQAELASLGQWTHINCMRASAQDSVQDQILRKLLHRPPVESVESDSTRGGKSVPQSRATSILAATDLDNILAMDEENALLTVREVPEGTVSYLFEKSSAVALADDETPAED
jgi:DNA repair and recombination protein RAD54B